MSRKPDADDVLCEHPGEREAVERVEVRDREVFTGGVRIAHGESSDRPHAFGQVFLDLLLCLFTDRLIEEKLGGDRTFPATGSPRDLT